MANVYVCRIRNDLGSGGGDNNPFTGIDFRSDLQTGDNCFQILDLTPNNSRYSIYETPSRGFYDSDFDGTCDMSAYGQSGYVGRKMDMFDGPFAITAAPVADPVGAAWSTDGTDGVTWRQYTGLAAYLLDRVEKGGAAGNIALTGVDAWNCALILQGMMEQGAGFVGDDMDLTNINLALVAGSGAANTELTTAGGSASSGSIEEILQIMSGAYYTLPGSSAVEAPLGTFNPSILGSFDDTKYHRWYRTGEFDQSLAHGELSAYADANFSAYGTAGAAVQIYTDAGVKLSRI